MSADILRYFGGKVREKRQQKGISQEELADLAGVHRTYIGMIERAEKISRSVISKKLHERWRSA